MTALDHVDRRVNGSITPVALLCALLVAAAIACSPAASKGTMPPPAPNGQVDPEQVPDFIAYVGQSDHTIGWVPKACLGLDPSPREAAVQEEPCPVYADDLATLIGHEVPGKGYVPLGVDPNSVPPIPASVAPSPAGPSTAASTASAAPSLTDETAVVAIAERLTSIAGPWTVGGVRRGSYRELWQGSTSDVSGQGSADRQAKAAVVVWRVDLSGPSGVEELYIEAATGRLVDTIIQGN